VPNAKAQASKTQLIDYLRETMPSELSSVQLQRLQVYLNGQMLWTFDDITKLGPEGLKQLAVNKRIRQQFQNVIIKHIGMTEGVDDQRMVTVPKPKPPAKKDDCYVDPNPYARFMQSVDGRSSVGEWLRRMYPDVKPAKMTRVIKALGRQSIKTFDDLNSVGVSGVRKLLYVPAGVRDKLYEAIIWHLGVAGGHDDERPVTAIDPTPKRRRRGVLADLAPPRPRRCRRK